MQKFKRLGWSLVMLLVVATALLMMMGMFWVLEIAPLVLFIGMAVMYGILSRSPKAERPTMKDRSVL